MSESHTYLQTPFTELPAQRFVGILSCQCDPDLRTLLTRVVACNKVTAPPVPKTNTSKKAAKEAGATQNVETYEIELLDTVLFPEGGGQLYDTGVLELEDGHRIAINKVLRRGLVAIHYASEPIEVGADVLVICDYERRLDVMQQHTGQHLLSSVLEESFNTPTLGWSLSPWPTPSYIEIPNTLSPSDIQACTSRCNTMIREGSPVTVDISLQDSENTKLTKIPADYTGGVVRQVQINSPLIPHDRNPCCGTHFKNISALQSMHILPNLTPIRGTNFRLYFLVGARVIQNLSESLETCRLAALEFGGTDNLPLRVKSTLDSLRDANRKERRLREELVPYLAKDLISRAQTSPSKSAFLLRSEEEIGDLLLIAQHLKSLPDTVDQYLYILASSNANASSPILILGSDPQVRSAVERCKAAFNNRLRGGGKDMFQGKLESKLGAKDASILERILDH